ncbi:Photosystem I assembly protein Ycf3 [Synechococcus sp. MIT S9504]|nr:Photosystem I assembly protein Ycf3 [Synechococcus sp. MIT S9504]
MSERCSASLDDSSKNQYNPVNTMIDLMTNLVTIQELSAGGCHQECLQACQNALQVNPDEAYAYKYSGKSLLALGQFEKAQQCLVKAHQLDGSDPETIKDIGNIFNALQNDAEAIRLYKAALSIDQNYAPAVNNLGLIAQRQGNLEEAEKLVKKASNLDQSCSLYYINLGVIYKDLGQLDQALAVILKSLELKPDNPYAHMSLGVIYKDLGQLDQALAAILKSLELKPDNPDAHVSLGMIYKDLGQLNQSLAATLKSLELNPDNPDAHLNMSGIFKELGNFKEANKAIKRSFDSKKLTLPIAIQGFEYYDSTNQKEELNQAIESVNKLLGSDNSASSIYNARSLFHEKEYRSSLEALEAIDVKSLFNTFSSIKYYFFRGLAEEKLGLYEQAFNHFMLAQKVESYRNITPASSWVSIKSYTTLAEKIKPITAVGPDPIHSPVFLVGFPRSGTTLLDTVLRSHPLVEVVEEKVQLDVAEQMAIKKFGKKIEDFADLQKMHLDRLRLEYFKRLYSHVRDPGKIIIDKLPLNIVKIPLINVLFPNAKVILAIRHPCDSVLSCFQQTFKPNSSMANFTSLAGSITFYSKVMTAWNKYCESFPFDHCTTKYEDLIIDFDGSMAKILSFLGIEWNESIKNYRKTALKRGAINTPSATQVSQPLYKTSIGKWRNYERHFEEHLPLLNPWIKQWGYS